MGIRGIEHNESTHTALTAINACSAIAFVSTVIIEVLKSVSYVHHIGRLRCTIGIQHTDTVLTAKKRVIFLKGRYTIVTCLAIDSCFESRPLEVAPYLSFLRELLIVRRFCKRYTVNISPTFRLTISQGKLSISGSNKRTKLRVGIILNQDTLSIVATFEQGAE